MLLVSSQEILGVGKSLSFEVALPLLEATVCPGVTVHENAILTVGGIATRDMERDGIYQGIPCVKIRERRMCDMEC